MESARARAAIKRFSPADVPQGIPYEGITKVNRSLIASLRWDDSSCWCSWLGDPRDVDGMDLLGPSRILTLSGTSAKDLQDYPCKTWWNLVPGGVER